MRVKVIGIKVIRVKVIGIKVIDIEAVKIKAVKSKVPIAIIIKDNNSVIVEVVKEYSKLNSNVKEVNTIANPIVELIVDPTIVKLVINPEVDTTIVD